MGYKTMNYTIYVVLTVSLYFLQVLGSILIDDIGIIFEIISAVSISTSAYIFPGLFYIVASKKYQSVAEYAENTRIKYKSYFFIIFCFSSFLIQMTSVVFNIFQDIEKEGEK